MYGAAVWSLKVISQTRLYAFDQWCLRHILCIPYVSSSEVCSRTGRPPITTLIKQRQLKLFGHVARAEQAEDHNRVLQASLNPPGNWRRGREDALVRPSKELSVTILNMSCQPSSAYRQAQDRHIWWKTVETAMLTLWAGNLIIMIMMMYETSRHDVSNGTYILLI